jgi:hypothetical protein
MEVEALIEELDQAAIDLTNHDPDSVPINKLGFATSDLYAQQLSASI